MATSLPGAVPRPMQPIPGQRPVHVPQSAMPKKKLLEKELPPGIEGIYPEAVCMKQLIDAEKRLDTVYVKKQLALQESVISAFRHKKLLRIFLSSVVADQPWSSSDNVRIPCWTFRIEGYIVDSTTFKIIQPQPARFSSFFKSIVIEIHRSQSDPSAFPDDSIVEWQKTQLGRECDGFEVKRLGDQDVTLKIHFKPDYMVDKFKLAPELGHLLRIKCETRPAILLALWKYVSFHRLYMNHTIHNNEALKGVFHCDTMSFDSLPERLSRLIFPVDVVTLEYIVAVTDKERSHFASAYDMTVELPDPHLKPLFPMPQQTLKDIGFLDQKILELIALIHIGMKRRSFLKAFKDDPNTFIQQYLDAICSGMGPVLDTDGQGNEDAQLFSRYGLSYEDVRKSATYQQPWISDAIFQYLSTASYQQQYYHQ